MAGGGGPGTPVILERRAGGFMAKAAEAFRTISEVADDLGIQKHVLRFWEVKFSQIRPMKRGGGRRYYRPEDMELLRGIRQLLHRDGYTIKGVQKILREQGVEAVKTRARAGGAALAAREAEVQQPPEIARSETAQKAPAGARGAKSREEVAAPKDRSEILRAIVSELVQCREILAGRASAGEATAPRRSRRSA
jgi:DNA-binding transcriptional MerR regulator